MKTKGMTLVEVMITVLIIGIVAAIAIPAASRFGEEARARVCLTNLKAIDNAKVQWAVENNEPDEAEPTEEELAEYIIGDVPQCVVAGALYKIGDVITPALCSYHGNQYIDGWGLKLSPGIINLVDTGKISATDVMDGSWAWGRVGNLPFVAFLRWDSSSGQWVSVAILGSLDNADLLPEMNINGEVLRGSHISRYTEESIDKLKVGNDRGEYYASKMSEGGYLVINEKTDGYSKHYYDLEGNLVGYEVYNRLERHSYHYNSEGNLVE